MRYNKAGKEIIAITDSRICKGDVLERIELLAQSGAKAIILREKQLEASAYRALAERALAICARAGVACILHSFIEVARELGVSALHCQSAQIPHLPRLRREFATLGVSVHSVEEYKAAREWVDYVIVGHIFASSCKVGVEARGVELLESIIALESTFCVGVGFLRKSGEFVARCVDRPPVLSPCSPLHNPTFSSKILPPAAWLSNTFSAFSLESTFENSVADTQKVDSSDNAHFSVIASRDSGVAIHTKNTQILESQSSFTKQAENKKVDSSPALQGLYAIGGITLDTLPALANMPISGVCMRQALMQAPNPKDYIRSCRLT